MAKHMLSARHVTSFAKTIFNNHFSKNVLWKYWTKNNLLEVTYKNTKTATLCIFMVSFMPVIVYSEKKYFIYDL